MSKIATVTKQGNRNFLEIQLPHAFIATPITDAGIAQLHQDIQEIFEAREKEILTLENQDQQ